MAPRLPAPGKPLLVASLVLAAGLLGAGLVGDALRPPGEVAGQAYTVRSVELGRGQARLGEGEAWVGHVPVGSQVLREVTATLTWEDDAPGSAPDEFTLELVPPEGLLPGAPAEGAGGELEVVVPVHRAPVARAVVGSGTWNLRVYLRSAGDASTAGLLPGAFDRGNDFELVVRASVFEPVR